MILVFLWKRTTTCDTEAPTKAMMGNARIRNP
jgi:hypothetical protein